jgi:D-aminoacyl-tRNA deacylase
VIAVVQRVLHAAVTVREPAHRAQIGRGLCVLLAVERGDGDAQARWMAAKLAGLRIFPDDDGKMNRSVIDVGGEILLVSQFTLVGDCEKGMRPSFIAAADPDEGNRWYEAVAMLLRSDHQLQVPTGVFRASMQVEIMNDGPVTLIVRRPPSTA